MAIKKANAAWEGTLKEGQGMMKPAHAEPIRYSAGTRFEGQEGSNPEEVIGAALAGCFSMALSLGLEKAGATPRSIRTTAAVRLDSQDGGFAITAIDLATEVNAENVEEAKFQEIAEQTKQNCPVSKALASVDKISVDATLASG